MKGDEKCLKHTLQASYPDESLPNWYKIDIAYPMYYNITLFMSFL